MKVHSENPVAYLPRPSVTESDDETIQRALAILKTRLAAPGYSFRSPQDVKTYCMLLLGGLEHEEFGVLFLDSQHGVIAFKSLFRGTLTQTAVYPREVVREALRVNAGSVIFTHNHPSGDVAPSRADENLTATLKAALALVDVKVLDHIVVSSASALSFAESGLV